MKRIEVKLSLPVVAPLLDTIKAVAGTLKTRLAVDATPLENDSDMAASWNQSLLEAQNAEVDALLALFDSEFFRTGTLRFDSQNGGQIIRACAALRLKIRADLLGGFTDEALEQGIPGIDKLPAPLRRATMCHMFLATIQELIIQHLEKWISGEKKE